MLRVVVDSVTVLEVLVYVVLFVLLYFVSLLLLDVNDVVLL